MNKIEFKFGDNGETKEQFFERMKKTARERNITYRCPKCRDNGYIKTGDNQFERCECEVKRIASERMERQGFKPGEMTMKDFNVDTEIAKRMKALAERYISSYPTQKSMGVFGQVGTGKTHLIVGTAQKLMDDGRGVVYMPYVDMIAQLRQTIFNAEEYGRLIDGLKHCELLVIDDFLKGNLLPNDLSIMFELINYRYLNKKPIIVSSEKLVTELNSIDEALGSRIAEMTFGNRVQIAQDSKKNRRIIE